MARDDRPVIASESRDTLGAAVDLPINPQAAALGRRTVRDVLRGWQVDNPGLRYDAELATSELVTNAIRHGGHHVRLELSLTGNGLRVAVSDGSPALPAQRSGEDDDEGGRGLAILASLGAWGVETTATGGKRVWVQLPLRASGGGG